MEAWLRIAAAALNEGSPAVATEVWAWHPASFDLVEWSTDDGQATATIDGHAVRRLDRSNQARIEVDGVQIGPADLDLEELLAATSKLLERDLEPLLDSELEPVAQTRRRLLLEDVLFDPEHAPVARHRLEGLLGRAEHRDRDVTGLFDR